MYCLIKNNGTARRGEFKTVHGTVQTPAFMNVATDSRVRQLVVPTAIILPPFFFVSFISSAVSFGNQ